VLTKLFVPPERRRKTRIRKPVKRVRWFFESGLAVQEKTTQSWLLYRSKSPEGDKGRRDDGCLHGHSVCNYFPGGDGHFTNNKGGRNNAKPGNMWYLIWQNSNPVVTDEPNQVSRAKYKRKKKGGDLTRTAFL